MNEIKTKAETSDNPLLDPGPMQANHNPACIQDLPYIRGLTSI